MTPSKRCHAVLTPVSTLKPAPRSYATVRLADIEYDVIVDTGIEPQGWPISESEWRNPELHENPPLVRAMRRDGRPIEGTS